MIQVARKIFRATFNYSQVLADKEGDSKHERACIYPKNHLNHG